MDVLSVRFHSCSGCIVYARYCSPRPSYRRELPKLLRASSQSKNRVRIGLVFPSHTNSRFTTYFLSVRVYQWFSYSTLVHITAL